MFQMKTIGLALAILIAPTGASLADDVLAFKGIKFGMNAEEIAELAGGDTSRGCRSAILTITDAFQPGRKKEDAWSYGGVNNWRASCVEDDAAGSGDLAFSGLYRLEGLAGKSVDDLVDIFSVVFGDFRVSKVLLRDHTTRQLAEGKIATATHKGASIVIEESLHNGSWLRTISITSIEYMEKWREWGRKNRQLEQQKRVDPKTDF